MSEDKILRRRNFLAGAAALPLATACRSTPPPSDGDETARLDELLRDLRDQSSSISPIDESERKLRRARLGLALESSGCQALFCEAGATMTWLSGVSWGFSERTFGLIVFADGSHAWICPAFETEKARLRIEGEGRPGGKIVSWNEHEYAFAPLAGLLRDHRVERVAFDPQTRLFIADRLGAAFGRDRLLCGTEIVADVRMVKEPHELALLRRANELTKLALGEVAKHVHAGMRTAEIAALVARAQERLGLQSVWNLTLVGAAAAHPHGELSEQKLGKGDLLLVDTGGSLHDYQSDITRTWVGEGTPRAREERAWHSVRSAQKIAFEAMRPGVECRAIDRSARASIAAAGWGADYVAMGHRLGHGIGLEGHEDPYFDGGSTLLLRPGMTFSDEPGIYILGEFGVRIEDIVAITETGAEVFGPWQESPLTPS